MKIAHRDFKVCGGSCLGELCFCAAFHGFRLFSAFLTCDVLLCAIFSTCRIKHVQFKKHVQLPCGEVTGNQKDYGGMVGNLTQENTRTTVNNNIGGLPHI